MRGLSFSPTHSIPPGMSLLGYKIVEDGYFLPRGLVADFDLVIRRKRAVHLYLCSAKPTRSSKNYDLQDALTGTASYRIICATPMHVRHFALDARKAIGGIAAHLSTL